MAGAYIAFFSALPIITGAITVLDCLSVNQARRLYNGFLEGEPRIATDLYGATLVLHKYADPPVKGDLLRRRLRNPKNTLCV